MSGNIEIEKDSDENEDSLDILSIITTFESQSLLENTSIFGFHYNKKVFRGWVKQPSPCCAAASVAGAWNALFDLHRSDLEALNYNHILSIYRGLMDDKIYSNSSSFERKLGAKFSSDFWEEFNEILANNFGKFIGGKKSSSVTKKFAEKALVIMIKRNLSSMEEEFSKQLQMNEIPMSRSCLFYFKELLESEGTSLEVNSNDFEEKDEQKGCEDDSGDEIEEDSEEEEEPGSSKSSKSNKSKKWNWKKDFMEIIRLKSGLTKLNAEKPSTAVIGNWGILDSIKTLSEEKGFGTQISARLFMGKKKTAKTKLDFPLSKKDESDTIVDQWNGLRSAFADPTQIILFHLKNHYALIYAIREWYDEVNKVKRYQVLTARRGQRPTAWIDFSECRETLLSWEGYKMILIKNNSQPLELYSSSSNSKK